ncbi:MAG: MFS transporter [Acidiphilium sp.]
MMASILSVRSLLLAVFGLMAGSGFLSTLLSLRLQTAGVPALLIGLIGTAYYAGLTVGSLRAARVIGRVGHIRAFAAFLAVFTAATLAFALHQAFWLWAALRFVQGVSLAGVFICVESWLNERAEARTRGSILAFYMIATYGGSGTGQFLLDLGKTEPTLPFIASAILLSLAVLPVVLTRIPSPSLDASSPLPFRRLYAISPLGIAGASITGLMLGAFYALGAVYVHGLGLDQARTATFMSAVIFGGVALQMPIGRLSDRFDRRTVLIATFTGVALVALALGLGLPVGRPLLGLGALFGGLLFTLYPLCVAHTNDYLTPAQRVGASGGLILIYSVGAAVGPIIAAAVMTGLGPGGLFDCIAAAALGAAGFGLWRRQVRVATPNDRQLPYQGLPQTTPMSATLDPNAAEEDGV